MMRKPVVLLTLAGACANVWAQAYPAKPLRLIVDFAPGRTDTAASPSPEELAAFLPGDATSWMRMAIEQPQAVQLRPAFARGL